jgi:hypothetical protein
MDVDLIPSTFNHWTQFIIKFGTMYKIMPITLGQRFMFKGELWHGTSNDQTSSGKKLTGTESIRLITQNNKSDLEISSLNKARISKKYPCVEFFRKLVCKKKNFEQL